jgi:hypothetical protein
VALAGLTFTERDPGFNRQDLQDLLNLWRDGDSHHIKDQAFLKDFTRSPSNAKIHARNEAGSARR